MSFFNLPFLVLLLLLLLLPFTSAQSSNFHSFSLSNSPWHPSENRTLISPNSTFAAGFRRRSRFFPNHFIFSIWYLNISNHHTIIWSANWDHPVQNTASLIITPSGEIQLINATSGPNIWPDPPTRPPNSTRLLLRDDGNLVFGSWESFDRPTNTFLPTQNFTKNTVLRSRNGKFKFVGSKDLVFNGSGTYWSSAKGFVSLGIDGRVTQNGGDPIYPADFGQVRTRRLTLDEDGNLRILSFDPDKRIWVVVWVALLEICQVQGLCGPGYICYSDESTISGYECVCPPGFMRSPLSDSCVSQTPVMDYEKSMFLRLDYVNYSGGSNQTNDVTYKFASCRSKCIKNHKCLGFGFKFDGSGHCVLQIERLLNGYWSPYTEMSFYLRVHQSEPDLSNFTGMSEVLNTTCPTLVSLPDPSRGSNNAMLHIILVSFLFTFEVGMGVLLFWTFLKKYVKYRDMARTLGLGLWPKGGPKRFAYGEIKLASKDFSEENLIGKGGFSDVYKGNLQDGRPVAIKCLKNVTGGDSEFWAEVTIIARMHHLNLVRLWGFCNLKGQRILVYEHVPNGSLDKYLFRRGQVALNVQESRDESGDSISGLGQDDAILDWHIRYRIALGVARAVAYLHEECLEWVLHCDIKPENILLGDDFCPKVADFGVSKLWTKEQLVTMSKIRGTRGYLAPEWVKHDPVTSKVDVFSFGMVLLEIVTGVRNVVKGPSFIPSEEWYFPKWAFEMAIEEQNMEEILDRQIKHSYDDKVHFDIVNRMVKTAMWCVQEKPEMRPSMGKAAKMLEGTVEIMEPPKPTMFYI